jgi:hypothetical protein
MALTIAPAVSGTRQRFLTETLIFYLGVVVGGMVSFLGAFVILGAVQAFGGRQAAEIVACGAVLWTAAKDLGLPLWVPYRNGQVPESLRDLLPRQATAAVFGFLLGVGFATYFTYSAHAAMLLGLPFLTNGWIVALSLLLLALGKTTPVLASIGGRDTDEIGAHFRWSRYRLRAMRVGTAASAVTVAGLIVW